MKKMLAALALSALVGQPTVFSQRKPMAAAPVAPPSGGVKLIEKVVANPGKLVIPYEKYVLPNGLTVIVTEDHSDPVVHVDVTYHVGSAREEIGKSGFAHFFEHMMFQGSDNVADDEHFKIVTESGGTLNGTTNRDRTNYFETMPNNQLERALWLEADRMGFLLDSVTTRKFENQRETVKNERGQNYDNRPYGLMSEYVAKNLYPYGHPYSWLTIGYIEDLNRVGVQDLKNFFLRWYGPNNATLTVGGDVKTSDVLRLAQKYFGPIGKCPAVTKTIVPPAVLTADRYVSYEDNIRFPALSINYPSVPSGHPDEPALDCLAEIIGQGANSLLYKNVVKTQKSLGAQAFNGTYELAGEFTIRITASPGNSLASLEQEYRKTLTEFEQRGVTDDDLKRFKAKYETDEINSLATVSGKVRRLAASQTFFGNPNTIQKDLDARLKLTKADVINAYNKYIKGHYAVILSVVPKGKTDMVAAKDNYSVNKSGYKQPADQYSGLVYKKAKDVFDRKVKPSPGSNPVIKVPPYWTATEANGLKLIGSQSKEIPTVTILLNFDGGHLFENENPFKCGTANLLCDMLGESTEKYTTEEINSELDKLGSQLQISPSAEGINIEVSCLRKNLDATLALLDQAFFHPRFDQADFDRVKKQTLEAIVNRSTNATALASLAFNKQLYGKDNTRAYPVLGTEESVKAITLADVKQFYKTTMLPSLGNIVVVGDVTQAEILPKLATFRNWSAPKADVPKPGAAPAITKNTVFLVDKEKAPQSEIRIGYEAIPYDATGDYYKATLANYLLGGAFNSRINMNLRESKGWTYGARSSFSGTNLPGPFMVSAGVKGRATDSSVVEILKEIKNFVQNGITEKELEFLKNSIGQSEALKYESLNQKAGFLSRISYYNLPKDYLTKQNEILKNLGRKDIQDIAQKYLPYEKLNIVVVGDRVSVKKPLEKLGYPVVDLDKEGNQKISVPTDMEIMPTIEKQAEEKQKPKK